MSKVESTEMDQDRARRLLVEGATFVFLDVPAGTQFGIDMKTWTTGEKFKGVKMIPPGIHFVYFSATNNHGDVAPRVGFMHDFKRSEFVVKKWDSENEGISLIEVSDIEVARLKADLLNLDRYLGPYPFDAYKKWKSLTDRITVNHLSRLVPTSGWIRSALELSAGEMNASPKVKKRRSRPSTAEEKEDDLLPELKPVPGTELRLTHLPLESYPKGSTPAEITKHSLDQSYTLESMLSTYENVCDLIGELQFTFVCFLVGYSLEALDHWKMLVKLLCSCETAVSHRTQLYSQFIEALEVQLAEIPEDFLVDIVASNNVIYRSLRDLFRTMQTCASVEGRLRSRADRFRNRLTEKFMWDFSHLDEDEEDEAPVVVAI